MRLLIPVWRGVLWIALPPTYHGCFLFNFSSSEGPCREYLCLFESTYGIPMFPAVQTLTTYLATPIEMLQAGSGPMNGRWDPSFSNRFSRLATSNALMTCQSCSRSLGVYVMAWTLISRRIKTHVFLKRLLVIGIVIDLLILIVLTRIPSRFLPSLTVLCSYRMRHVVSYVICLYVREYLNIRWFAVCTSHSINKTPLLYAVM
jgi:hypothetical protein